MSTASTSTNQSDDDWKQVNDKKNKKEKGRDMIAVKAKHEIKKSIALACLADTQSKNLREAYKRVMELETANATLRTQNAILISKNKRLTKSVEEIATQIASKDSTPETVVFGTIETTILPNDVIEEAPSEQEIISAPEL